MPKLHLKRTPEEEAAHRWRKQQRREAKRKRHAGEPDYPTKRNRHLVEDSDEGDLSDGDIGPIPGPSSPPRSKSDFQAEMENDKFYDSMAYAMGEDERLDSVEAKMNSYAHVPKRWRTAGGSTFSYGGTGNALYDMEEQLLESEKVFEKTNPENMDDETYAEWIRAGMYYRKHKEEFEEKRQKEAERAKRKAAERARREETAKLEKAADENRRRRRKEKENTRLQHSREEYDRNWKELILAKDDGPLLAFHQIPWPVGSAWGPTKSTSDVLQLSDLTLSHIAEFLLGSSDTKTRKEKLRENFLRWHPDKFEGRVLRRVTEKDREKVREAANIVVGHLNALQAHDSGNS